MSDVISDILFYNNFMDKNFFVYIILTERNTLYCGYTDDVERRFELHKSGKGAKYTRANKPLKIVYTKKFPNKIDAQREERRIKKLSRTEKIELINNFKM